jgi:hypothetical protein
MPDWQSLETLPKDGTIVILLTSTGEQDVGRWSRGELNTVWGLGDYTSWTLAGI